MGLDGEKKSLFMPLPVTTNNGNAESEIPSPIEKRASERMRERASECVDQEASSNIRGVG